MAVVNASTNVVCESCWIVFPNSIDLELHRNHCPQLVASNKDEDVATSSTTTLNKVELDSTTEGVLNNNDNSDAELAILKTMPPTNDEGVIADQNGELLSVFEQSTMMPTSASTVEGALQEFNISMPSQSILGSYIQQQQQTQQESDLAVKESELKNQTDESLNQQQLLQHQASLLATTQHQVLLTTTQHQASALLTTTQHQASTLLTTATTTTASVPLLENGLKPHLQSSMKADKSTYKRKLLPKSSRNSDIRDKFKCSQCESIFYNDASYRDHARSHTKVKDHTCEYCGITMTKYEQLTKHLDKEHNSDLSRYCYLCYSPAEDKESLHEHVKYCGKNDSVKNRVNQAPTTNTQALPHMLSGSTMKYNDSDKNMINCLKCGQFIGNGDTFNIQDKAVDVQCKVCGTIMTLTQQLPLSTEPKPTDLLGQQVNHALTESLLLSSIENSQSVISSQATNALYSQSNSSSMPQNVSIHNNTISIPSLNDNDIGVNASGLPSMTLPATVGGTNHMALGINTSTGMVLVTLPVVTSDKMAPESVTAPMLQLPSGNFILLGDLNAGSPLPPLGTGSPIPAAMLPATSTSSSPILQTNDMLMAAAACINSPSSPELVMPSVSTEPPKAKLKMSRYMCQVCSKTYETQQSCKRHMQTHGPKKQHTCQICGKVYTRPGQLREHISKLHGTQQETNNNEVSLIKIKS